MLKNDMRKYIIAGKTFEEFVEDYGEEYQKEFTMDVMARCWKNTHKLVPKDEWHKYLKSNASSYVRYLTMVADALNEEGIALREIKAGYLLNDLLRKQLYGGHKPKLEPIGFYEDGSPQYTPRNSGRYPWPGTENGV